MANNNKKEVLPLNECVANLKIIGLDDQEIAHLDKTLDIIIDHQLDEILNKFN